MNAWTKWMTVGSSAALLLAVGCSSKSEVKEEPVVQTQPQSSTQTVTETEVVPKYRRHARNESNEVVPKYRRHARATATQPSVVERRETVTSATTPVFPSLVATEDESKSAYLSRAHDIVDRLDDQGKSLEKTGDANRVQAFQKQIDDANTSLKRLTWSTGTGWRKYTPSIDQSVVAARAELGTNRAIVR